VLGAVVAVAAWLQAERRAHHSVHEPNLDGNHDAVIGNAIAAPFYVHTLERLLKPGREY
jgi:hypothetical protein